MNLNRVVMLVALFGLAPAAAAESPDPVLAPIEVIDAATLGLPTPIDDPSGRALNHFYQQLAKTKRGEAKTRIAVFGASHVAGDVFTRVVRHALKHTYGDAGIGFVVPAKPWRDYYNRDANISYSRHWESNWVSKTRSRDDGLYGLAGVSFTAESKRARATVETAKRSEFGKTISRVEVFYWKQKKGGDFSLFVDGRFKKRVKTRTKRKEEPGTGYVTVLLDDAEHKVELRPRGNGPVTLFGMALDRDVPGVVMDSMGINGARAADQLEWDPRIFAEHLAKRDPNLIVLAYGTNAIGDDDDPIEKYEKRLDLVMTRLKSLLPKASCLYVGPSDRPIKLTERTDSGDKVTTFLPRPRQTQVIDVQRRVAHRYGCGFWDWAAAMGGDLSMLSWTHADERMGARDYVHLTRRGYERIGDLFLDALMDPLAKVKGAQVWPPAHETIAMP